MLLCLQRTDMNLAHVYFSLILYDVKEVEYFFCLLLCSDFTAAKKLRLVLHGKFTNECIKVFRQFLKKIIKITVSTIASQTTFFVQLGTSFCQEKFVYLGKPYQAYFN